MKGTPAGEMAGALAFCDTRAALAWTMNKKPWIVPISGTRKPSHMQGNADASVPVPTGEETKAVDDAPDRTNLADTAAERMKQQEGEFSHSSAMKS